MSPRWRLSAFGDEIAPSLETQVDALHAQVINYLELRSAWQTNVVDLTREQLGRARDILQIGGIGVSAIGSPVGKVPITGDFAEEQRRLTAALTAAEELGTQMVRVFSFFIPDGRYGEHRAEVLRRMAAMAEVAAKRGITLVHENESYIYGDVPSRCLDIVQSVDSPALSLAYDPANFVVVGVPSAADAWDQLGKFVSHVHVKDAVPVDRTGFAPYPAEVPTERLMQVIRVAGEGSGQLPELLIELARQEYDGFLTVEPHLTARLPEQDGAERLAIAVAALRKLVASLD